MTKRLFYSLLLFIAPGSLSWAQQKMYAELATPFTIQVEVRQSNAPIAGQVIGPLEILQVKETGKGQFELKAIAYETGTFSLNELLAPAEIQADTILITITEPPAEKMKAYLPVREIPLIEENKQDLGWLPFVITAVIPLLVAGWLARKKKKRTLSAGYTGPNPYEILNEARANWESGKINSMQLGENIVSLLQAFYQFPIRRSTRLLVRKIQKQEGEAVISQLLPLLKKTDSWRFGKTSASFSEGKETLAWFESHLKKSKRPADQTT